MSSRVAHAASASSAGTIYQFDRALDRLVAAASGASVGIEALDDLAIRAADGAIELIEQCKLNTTGQGQAFGDRSENVWKTLRNWLVNWRASGGAIDSFHIVSNAPIRGELVSRLGAPEKSKTEILELVQAIRGAKETFSDGKPAGVTSLIQEVKAFSDIEIGQVIARIFVLGSDDFSVTAIKERTLSRMTLPDSVDQNLVYQSLLGWIHETCQTAWSGGDEAWIQKTAFSNHVYGVVALMIRRRVRERPAYFIKVDDESIASQRNSRFVTHLSNIHADDSIIESAIADYIRFLNEKVRLTFEIGISSNEAWRIRGHELVDRWRAIFIHNRELNGRASDEVGRDILRRTTVDYRHPFMGDPTDNNYFTSGHYHRLANFDRVVWHPESTFDKDAEDD